MPLRLWDPIWAALAVLVLVALWRTHHRWILAQSADQLRLTPRPRWLALDWALWLLLALLGWSWATHPLEFPSGLPVTMVSGLLALGLAVRAVQLVRRRP